MTLNNRLLTTIQVAVLLYKERIGHEPGAILLERGAYDVVTEATREVTLIRGQNGKATVTLFGIPVERVLRPGYGFYISERCCVNPGGAENTVDAVPVVRCKDCKYYKPDEFECGCDFAGGLPYVKDDDFCSFGKRRDQSADVRNMDGGGADAP